MYEIIKDSRWAWMVCLGSFLSQLTIDGIGNSFGVVIDPLVSKIDSNVANVAWIKSIHTTFIFLFAFISSIIINKFGFRIVIWVGTVLSCTAFISSAFLDNYIGLFMSYGVLGGAGMGIIFTPANIACAKYFDKWKAISTGIAMSGGGIGTMIVPLLCNYVLMNDGSKGYFFTLAMVSCLNILFQLSASPLNKENQTDSEKSKEKQPTYQMYESDLHPKQRNPRKTNEELKLQQRNDSGHRRTNINSGRKLSDRTEITLNRQESIALSAYLNMIEQEEEIDDCHRSNRFYSLFSLLKDKRMFWYCLANGCYDLAFDIPFLFLPDMMIQDEKIPRQKVGLVFTILGLFFVIGKFLTGLIVQFLKISPIILSFVCMLLLGCCSISLTFCSTYEEFAIASAAYGLMLASVTVFIPLILIEVFGDKNLSEAYGLLMFVKMFFVLWGPPIVGAIIDHTGLYKAAFYASGSFQLLGGIVSSLVFLSQIIAVDE